jgi:tetratricopeptide (TPR) repeat protein
MLRRTRRPFLVIAAILTTICIWLLLASRTDTNAVQSAAGTLATIDKHPGPVAAHGTSHSAASAIEEHELGALRQALQKKPDHAPILVRLAVIAASKGQNKEAIGYLKEALQHDPVNMEARLELGRALFNSGNPQGAIEETQKILDKQPRNPDALYNLGAIYGNLGKPELAEKYWRALLDSSPESESGKLARASLAQLTGSSSARSF